MRAFEVRLNGKMLCTAGVGEAGVLTAIVSWVRRQASPIETLEISVGGMISGALEHMEWQKPRLRAGDEVIIRIVETDAVDEPKKRHRFDTAESLRREKQYVRRKAKEYGWKLVPLSRTG